MLLQNQSIIRAVTPSWRQSRWVPVTSWATWWSIGATLRRRDGPPASRRRAPHSCRLLRPRRLRPLRHAREDLGPVVAQRLGAHEQAEVPAARHAADDVLRGRPRVLGDREDLLGRRDVVVGAAQQEQRGGDAPEVHPLAADL